MLTSFLPAHATWVPLTHVFETPGILHVLMTRDLVESQLAGHFSETEMQRRFCLKRSREKWIPSAASCRFSEFSGRFDLPNGSFNGKNDDSLKMFKVRIQRPTQMCECKGSAFICGYLSIIHIHAIHVTHWKPVGMIKPRLDSLVYPNSGYQPFLKKTKKRSHVDQTFAGLSDFYEPLL